MENPVRPLRRFLEASPEQRAAKLSNRIAWARSLLSTQTPGRIQRARQWNAMARAGQAFTVGGSQEPLVVSLQDQVIGRRIYIDGEFDLSVLTKALQALNRRDVSRLIDVGANLGSICIPAVRRGMAASALAVEPDPLNFQLLEINVRLNGLDSAITCVQAAAGSREGELHLRRSGINLGNHQIDSGLPPLLHADEFLEERVAVKALRLDDLVETPDPTRDLLFMDIQGFEIEALRGATSTLAVGTPLVMEFAPHQLTRYSHITDLVELFTNHRQFINLQGSQFRARPISDLTALADEVGLGGEETNILIV